MLGRSLLCLAMKRILRVDAEFYFFNFPYLERVRTEKCWFRTLTILELLPHLHVTIFKELYIFCPCQLHHWAFFVRFSYFPCWETRENGKPVPTTLVNTPTVIVCVLALWRRHTHHLKAYELRSPEQNHNTLVSKNPFIWKLGFSQCN